MSNTPPSSADNLFADALKAKATAVDAALTSGGPVTAPPPAPNDDEEAAAPPPTELDMLKARAKIMNISHSPNIGVEALRAKIKAKLDGEADNENAADQAGQNDQGQGSDQAQDNETKADASSPNLSAYTAPVPAPATNPVKEVKKTAWQIQYEEQMRLVRVRVTNLNPTKKDLPGEIFTFANRVLGAVRKFVPYGEATENGYHIPFCIYEQLKERQFQNIRTRKDSRGRTIVETSMAREFALEVLPPLTELELARLAASQAAAKGMD